MAVPTRPVAGAPIDSVWGQVAHDTAVAQDIQTGLVTTSHSANVISGVLTITFPRPFASAPTVIYQSDNYNYTAASDGTAPSATQAKVATRRADGTSPTATVPVRWFAYGPRA